MISLVPEFCVESDVTPYVNGIVDDMVSKTKLYKPHIKPRKTPNKRSLCVN